MSHPITLGQLVPADAPITRDALHVAAISVTAAKRLLPGARFELDAVGHAIPALEDHVGIVDPFLPDVVLKGERFWAVLPPGTTTNLSHTWSHHAFPEAIRGPITRFPRQSRRLRSRRSSSARSRSHWTRTSSVWLTGPRAKACPWTT